MTGNRTQQFLLNLMPSSKIETLSLSAPDLIGVIRVKGSLLCNLSPVCTENCNFAAMKEEMIRDRIVVGIRDSSLSERMQIDADLTLEKAKKMVRQC